MELEMDEILGLPAHPLIVHAVIALVPAAALLTIVAALWPAARRRIGWVGVVLAAAALVSVWIAQGSGEKLEDSVEETHLVEEHSEMGEQLLVPTIALLAGAILVTAVGRRDGRTDVVEEPAPAVASRSSGATVVGTVVAVLAIAASGVAVYQTYRIGHSGAKAVWDETGKEGQELDNSGSGGGGEQDEDGLGVGGALVAVVAANAAKGRSGRAATAGLVARPEPSAA